MSDKTKELIIKILNIIIFILIGMVFGIVIGKMTKKCEINKEYVEVLSSNMYQENINNYYVKY